MINKEESLKKIETFHKSYDKTLDELRSIHEHYDKVAGALEEACENHFDDHMTCINNQHCPLVSYANPDYTTYEFNTERLIENFQERVDLCKSILLSSASHHLSDDQLKDLDDKIKKNNDSANEFTEKKDFVKKFKLRTRW